MQKQTFAAVAIASALASPSFAQSGPPNATGITLPEHALRGQAAVDRLGDRADTVGRWYGKSGEHIKFMLKNDPSVALDRGARIFFIEEKASGGAAGQGAGNGRGAARAGGAAAPTASGPASIAVANDYSLDQTFQMHSKPGSSRVLYLDFTGHVAQGTVWNSSYGLSTINAPAFDLDGNPSSFSTAELQTIQSIWQRVAERYAPFDVDVTTQEPTADQLNKTSSGDTVYGWRAVITRDWTGGTSQPCGCGGFSYLSIFGNAYYSPSWIFYDQLASNDKYIADAVTHEVGHALGLSHDGTSTSGYYYGQGSGLFSWAPIMGVGYYANLVQWSKGEYPNANNTEDDIAIIAQNLPLRADDAGNTYAQSASLPATTSNGLSSFATSGVVSTATDVDVYNFYSAAGAISFTVAGINPGTDAKLYAELRDGAGNILASANPADSTNATVSANVGSAGQYYLVVTAVGYGDYSTGFPEYGSLGQYTVTGQAPAVAGVAPVAAASASPSSGTAPLAVSFSSGGSYDPDGSIVTYEWNFGDGSPLAYGPTASHSYAAGAYTAALRVVDNAGLSSTTTVSVNATQPFVAQQTMHVDGMGMSVQKQKNGTWATVNVTVRDGNGNLLPNASVSGSWAGKYSGGATATTGSNGVATMRTGKMGGNTGSVTFTVNGMSGSGYTYQSTANVVSVDTVSW